MKVVVFDLDGTLVDSAPEITAAMEHAWRAVGPGGVFPRERFRIGPPLHEIFAELAPALDAAGREALASAFRQRYDASDFSATLPYPGIDDVLAALRAKDAALAVATNKRRAPTLAILGRWFPEVFSRVACADGVHPDAAGGPAAGTWTKTAMLEWLSTTGAEVTMVGDTTSDLRAARAAGARAIAVGWGYEPPDVLAAARPDALVHAPSALLAALLA